MLKIRQIYRFNFSKICESVAIFLFCSFSTSAENPQFPFNPDSLNYHPKRLRAVLISEGTAYAGSMFLLNQFWYKDYPRSSFHFFNDNAEWLQMDKVGHFTTSYYMGVSGIKLLKLTGLEHKKAVWYGGAVGAIYLLNVEILDGFSSQWGFSVGDFSANTLGASLAIGQELAWNEQRILLKWSYHTTKYAKYRPNVLGNDLSQTWLKDYNGQTYWLSANIASFLKQDSKFPKWLNVAFGYGAEGMIGGYKNPIIYNGIIMPDFVRYRQFYLSPDIDFSRVKTKSKFLKLFFNALNLIKFPSPTLEYSKEKKLRFIPAFF
ncbi:MAG: DUF2279 domain-containing protein [Bacteroidetes bacterium]|nr:DUF2279 domain-containing protein [Bacteroidota bacterium]